jgi:hypothetical protein
MLGSGFPNVKQIPRAPWPDALAYIKMREPVIIESSAFFVPVEIQKDFQELSYLTSAMKVVLVKQLQHLTGDNTGNLSIHLA